MIRVKRGEILKSLLFFGGLWGLAEVTIGYLVHLVFPFPGFAAVIMFPLAFVFLRGTWEKTGRLWTMPVLASIAASIKLIDFIFPYLPPIKILNPIAGMFVEALAVMVFTALIKKKETEFRLPAVLMLTLAWRAAYLLLIALPVYLLFADGFLKYGLLQTARFIAADALLNTGLIILLFRVNKIRKGVSSLILKPYPFFLPAAAVLAAFGLELLI
ncbi:MAG: hypothetical protein E4H36_14405 [Spirochaetales bacterium]|nr:MAG: hypothetical protein E4H36_14405 [Spirochaetales bacterium]